MSYVLANDGKYYTNPVYLGDGWFICFDDEDPIELVIKNKVKPPNFEEMGFKQTSALRSCGQRLFNGKFHHAKHAWLQLTRAPRPPNNHEGIVERDKIKQGVLHSCPPKKV